MVFGLFVKVQALSILKCGIFGKILLLLKIYVNDSPHHLQTNNTRQLMTYLSN